MDPNGRTPLAGVVEMETDTPVQAELTITDGIDLWTVTFPDVQQVHYLPVLGLKPDRSYTVSVEILPGGFVGSLIAATGPLPADFPMMTTVSNPAEMEPGFTLIDSFGRPGDGRPGYPMIVDNVGDVVWYGVGPDLVVRNIRQLVNGSLFWRGGSWFREMDLVGNFQLLINAEVPGLGLHHDLLRTPMGTYLSLDRETVPVEGYPTSVDDPAAPTQDTNIRDDLVVEFLPDATVRAEWLLTDMLEPTRVGYLSLRTSSDGYDWAHANAVTYDPSDDSIIVSARHQDAVIKFLRKTGELVWILGNHDNWPAEFAPFLLNPVSAPFRWQYAQHAPMLTGDGTLVLFDNGNNRASPFDGNPVLLDRETFSRGVEYEIDEEAMEVRQVWAYGGAPGEDFYSSFISDADWLPSTGNVLITAGGLIADAAGVATEAATGRRSARIMEVTHETPAQKLFELVVQDAWPVGGWHVYRAERIPSLYGGGS
jgi:arylsulfate sulfotransferase